jgi:predicted NBD/HSP70 family sugar kinase
LTHFSPLQKTIFSLLSEEAYSLADLKSTTQVSLPTLRQALQELSDDGWVCPVGRSSSTGGRRATLYGLNGETHLIIGVHLEIPAVNMVLSGLDGRILERTHEADQETLPPEVALRKIFAFVRHVQERYPQRRLLGIGLAMPGFIDPLTGQILYSIRAPEWQQFPLKLRLEQELGLPVSVENDVDCMTIAELARCQLPDATDMVYLGFSEGVKLSMLLGGQLIKGRLAMPGCWRGRSGRGMRCGRSLR